MHPSGERQPSRPGSSVPFRGILPVALIAASALSPLTVNAYVPSMTSIAVDLSSNSAVVALGLSLYLLTTAAIQLIAGPLSDRFGRRPVLICGLIAFLAGTVLCITADSVELFLLGRIVQAGSGVGIVLSRTIIRDLCSPEVAASWIGYVSMGLALAPMLGPALGGVIDTAFGWRAVFWFLGLLGIITLLLLVLTLQESNTSRGMPVSQQLRSYKTLFSTRSYWLYVGAAVTTVGIFYAFLGGAPFVTAAVLGMPPAEYGLWFMLFPAGFILGNFITGRVSMRVGITRLMIVGSIINLSAPSLIAALIFGGHISPYTFFGPMVLFGFGSGLLMPSSMAGGLSTATQAAGAAAGVLGATQFCVAAVASTVSAHFATRLPNGIGMVSVMLALAAVSCLFTAMARRYA